MNTQSGRNFSVTICGSTYQFADLGPFIRFQVPYAARASTRLHRAEQTINDRRFPHVYHDLGICNLAIPSGKKRFGNAPEKAFAEALGDEFQCQHFGKAGKALLVLTMQKEPRSIGYVRAYRFERV